MSNSTEWAHRLRQILIYRYGGHCIRCGLAETDYVCLEFAHIKETKLKGKGRGQKERYSDVRVNPNAYVLLCHECHLWLDGRKAT